MTSATGDVAAGAPDDDERADESHGRLRCQRAGTASSYIRDRTRNAAGDDRCARELPLAVQPGTDWRYGPSVNIQGHMVEKLSGESLDEFFRARIFAPLRMTDTGFWVDAPKLARLTPRLHLRSG